MSGALAGVPFAEVDFGRVEVIHALRSMFGADAPSTTALAALVEHMRAVRIPAQTQLTRAGCLIPRERRRCKSRDLRDGPRDRSRAPLFPDCSPTGRPEHPPISHSRDADRKRVQSQPAGSRSDSTDSTFRPDTPRKRDLAVTRSFSWYFPLLYPSTRRGG